MSRLTKEQALEPTEERTEEFHIPSKGGEVLLRGFTDVRTLDALNADIRKYSAAANRNIPGFEGLSVEEITRACWLSKGMADPELTFNDAVTFGREVGPVAELLVGRIAVLSGLTESTVAQKEDDLKADTFPVGAAEGQL